MDWILGLEIVLTCGHPKIIQLEGRKFRNPTLIKEYYKTQRFRCCKSNCLKYGAVKSVGEIIKYKKVIRN